MRTLLTTLFVALFSIASLEAQAQEPPPNGERIYQKLQELEQLKNKQREVEKEIEKDIADLRALDEKLHPKPQPRPTSELAQNFGEVYLSQWVVYYITQEQTIKEYGSWDNFFSYPLRPDFDKDTFDYNLFKHALSGNYYYLFYRSRGYGEVEAFKWTFISSLAFEFAVETYTERPSYQDIYQTPIYGTLVGMGAERIANYLHKQDSKLARGLSYIFNPMPLFNWNKKNDVVSYPQIDRESVKYMISWGF